VILKLAQAGDPVLRQSAAPLSRAEILSDPIQQLIESMKETMRGAPGVGLAAPAWSSVSVLVGSVKPPGGGDVF